MIEITLPFPPSTNTYWRHLSKGKLAGRTLISEKGREYRRLVTQLVAAEPRGQMTGRLAVHIDAYPPDRRRRDLDNLLKSLQDSMQHAGLYADDSQIDDLRIRRCPVGSFGRVVVRLSEIA